MINLKSFHCTCGLLCTSPKSHNEIVSEFENFHILKHEKLPEVLEDMKLRKMNDSELKQHLERVERVVSMKHDELSKTYNKNKFTIVKTETPTHLEHTIKCELVEAVVNSKDNKTILSCPKCDKILYEVSK